MSNDFDSRLRESFDAAPAGELLPGFDKDALWPHVVARTKHRQPLRIALPWLSHAAAVAAGLLLAWVVLPVADNENLRSAVVVHAPAVAATAGDARMKTQEVSAPSIAANTETAIVSRTPVGDVPAHRAESRAQVVLPARANDAALDFQPAPGAQPPADSAPHAPVAMTERPELRKENGVMRQPALLVVHLLDVAGDGESRLRAPVEPLARRGRSLFTRLLSRNKVPDVTGTAAADVIVMRPFLSR